VLKRAEVQKREISLLSKSHPRDEELSQQSDADQPKPDAKKMLQHFKNK